MRDQELQFTTLAFYDQPLFKEDQGHQYRLHHEACRDRDDLQHVALYRGLHEQAGQAYPGQQHYVHSGHAIAESGEHGHQAGYGGRMDENHGQPGQGFCGYGC